MDSKSKVWYLQHINLFGSLADHEIEDIARVLGDHHLPSGTELLAEQEDHRVCVIKDGVVRIHL
ncbi:MAG TPA: hypothetical protein VGW38_23585, partial [Chloroflexota bacterium]|nr:hypothetical protein [Chloroflexota bacterium]